MFSVNQCGLNVFCGCAESLDIAETKFWAGKTFNVLQARNLSCHAPNEEEDNGEGRQVCARGFEVVFDHVLKGLRMYFGVLLAVQVWKCVGGKQIWRQKKRARNQLQKVGKLLESAESAESSQITIYQQSAVESEVSQNNKTVV